MSVNIADNAPISADLALLNSPDLDNDPVENDVEEIADPIDTEDDDLPAEGADEDDLDSVDDPDADKDEEHEESLDDKVIAGRPTVTDINKKFPDFFKKFPEMKHMLFREQQYASLFPTVESAKEASFNSNQFDNMRNDLLIGDGKSFVTALKAENGLDNFSTGFLDNLATADKDLHWKVISPILQNAVRAAFNQGRRSGNANLENSAKWLTDYLFGNGAVGQIDPDTMDILSGKKSVVAQKQEPDEKESKAQKELNDLKIAKIGDFRSSVNNTVETSLLKDVNVGLDKYQLSRLEKKVLAREIVDKVAAKLNEDPIFVRTRDDLWKKAAKNGFKTTDQSSIITSVLARASSLIPSIRRTAVAEALKDSTSEISKRRSKIENINSRREIGSQGRPARETTSQVPSNPRNINWKKTSDMDLLSGRVTLRK